MAMAEVATAALPVVQIALIMALIVYVSRKFGSLKEWLSDPKNIIVPILLIVALGVALS